jgi:hypothetical protein
MTTQGMLLLDVRTLVSLLSTLDVLRITITSLTHRGADA